MPRTIRRQDLLVEVEQAFARELTEADTAGARVRAALNREPMLRELFEDDGKVIGVFPMTFWFVDPRKKKRKDGQPDTRDLATVFQGLRNVYVNGKGYRYLRKAYANSLVNDELGIGRNLIPLMELKAPAVYKPQGYHPGYRYPIRSLLQLVAFRRAINAINLKYAHYELKEDLPEDATKAPAAPAAPAAPGGPPVGVLGVDVPYTDPDWVSEILPGRAKNNPAVTRDGIYYFAEESMRISKITRAVKYLQQLGEWVGDWVHRHGAAYVFGGKGSLAKDVSAFQETFLDKPERTVANAGWQRHMRLVVKAPGAAKELWAIDPWMAKEAVDQSKVFKDLQRELLAKTGWTLVAKQRPGDTADQAHEGSCVIASFARALWIAHDGVDVALEHPIPHEYAVLALRLLRTEHRKFVNAASDDKRVEVSHSDNRPGSRQTGFKHHSVQSGVRQQKRVATAYSDKGADQRVQHADRGDAPACVQLKGTHLLAHQKAVINFLLDTNQRGMILFHSLGSGKTITSIAAAQCILPPGGKVVVAAPASIQPQFAREMKRLDFNHPYEVVTHARLAKKWEELVDAKTVLIIDEAHNFKNPEGTMTHAVLQAAHRAYKVLLATATPAQNEPRDSATMVSMVTGQPVASVLAQLESEDGIPPGFSKCLFSYYKTPIDLVNFPTHKEIFKTFRMSQDYYRKYFKLQQDYVKADDADDVGEELVGKNTQSFYNGIRRAVNRMGETLSSKLRWAISRTISDVRKGHKVVLFSGYRSNGVQVIQEKLEAKGIAVGTVDGSMTPARRGKVVQQYNSGEIKVLLITMAGAEGLDLKRTRTMIIVDPWWNAAKIDQIVGRVVRYKSHEGLPAAQRHVDVYFLVTKKPVKLHIDDRIRLSGDEYLYRLMEAKMDKVAEYYDLIRRNAMEKCHTTRQQHSA